MNSREHRENTITEKNNRDEPKDQTEILELKNTVSGLKV